MKTTTFSNKLRLQKETIVDLNNKEMFLVNGGSEFQGEEIPNNPIIFPITFSKCMTQCPSNDTAPLACCALC